MNREHEATLRSTLNKLEKTYQKILETQGYNLEVERIKLLFEMVKEQVKDANTHNTTSQTR